MEKSLPVLLSMRLTRSRAFTLVELLVVVAIITVLAALLMPALKSARDRAKTVRCANNLRQIGGGFYSYLNDRNGYFPYQWPESSWDKSVLNVVWDSRYNQYWCGGQNHGAGGGPPWSVIITGYLGRSSATHVSTQKGILDLMQCKANPWPWSNSPGWNAWAQSAPVSGYAMNLTMFPSNYRCATFAGATQCAWVAPDVATPGTTQGWDKRVNLGDIQNPSSVALLGEQPVNQKLSDNLYGNLYGLPNNWGISACSVTSGPNCSASYGINLEWRYPNCNGYIATLHNMGMNTLMVDGRVEWVSKSTLVAYSLQTIAAGVPFGANGSAGGRFWTDGKGILSQGVGWFAHQAPGGPWPE